MVDPSLQEINDREAQNAEQDQSTNSDSGGDDGGGSALDGLPVPAISKKQMLVVAVVVVAILVWQSRSSSSGSNGAAQMAEARKGEFNGEVEATPTGGPGEPDEAGDYDPEEAGRAVIPMNPGSELDKDEAALRFLIDNGTMNGGAS